MQFHLVEKFAGQQSTPDDNEYPPTERPCSADEAASVEVPGKATTIVGNDSNTAVCFLTLILEYSLGECLGFHKYLNCHELSLVFVSAGHINKIMCTANFCY